MFEVYSLWLPVLLLIGVFGLVATPIFGAADSAPIASGARISTLDGLRGFLALSVFFHHAAIFHSFAGGQPWGSPPDRLYALLGSYGVAMFFMITGFLFWGQLIDKGGKPGWLKLYIGRIFRLGPLYLAAVAAVGLTALGVAGFHLRESPLRVALEFLDWAVPLGFHMGPPINGYAHTKALINVIWSLRYEWLFYISLIFTSLFSRRLLPSIGLPMVGLIISLVLVTVPVAHVISEQAPFVALFSVGMLTAALRPLVPHSVFLGPAASATASALVLAVLFLFGTAYTFLPICALGAAFFLIANGTSIFGLLNTRPARRLGNISYGLYLLQLLVLWAAFELPAVHQLAIGAGPGYWMVTTGAMVALVVIATTAHALIERPGIEAGKAVYRWLSLRQAGDNLHRKRRRLDRTFRG